MQEIVFISVWPSSISPFAHLNYKSFHQSTNLQAQYLWFVDCDLSPALSLSASLWGAALCLPLRALKPWSCLDELNDIWSVIKFSFKTYPAKHCWRNVSKFLKVKFWGFLKICHSSVFKVRINFGICLLGLQKSCGNGIRRCINVLFVDVLF